MTLSIYTVVGLLGVLLTCAIVGYGTNNVIASSVIAQQSSSLVSEHHSNNEDTTIVQQSSGQLDSVSSSVSIGESISDQIISSTNEIVSNVVNETSVEIDRQSSGKIASSRLNLTSGDVEAILFGNWSLDSNSGFVANFIYEPSNGTDPITYGMSGFERQAINRINDDLAMAGTIDIVSNNGNVLQDALVTIMIQNGILVVGFDEGTQAANLFGGMPIIGFEQ
jgi:hypothetical protein